MKKITEIEFLFYSLFILTTIILIFSCANYYKAQTLKKIEEHVIVKYKTPENVQYRFIGQIITYDINKGQNEKPYGIITTEDTKDKIIINGTPKLHLHDKLFLIKIDDSLFACFYDNPTCYYCEVIKDIK